MIELDLERIMFKPIVLSPPPPSSWPKRHRILLKTLPLGPFLMCFYLIAYPKGLIVRDRIGFGANNVQTYFPQRSPPPPPRSWPIRNKNIAEKLRLGPFLLCIYLNTQPKGPIEQLCTSTTTLSGYNHFDRIQPL